MPRYLRIEPNEGQRDQQLRFGIAVRRSCTSVTASPIVTAINRIIIISQLQQNATSGTGIVPLPRAGYRCLRETPYPSSRCLCVSRRLRRLAVSACPGVSEGCPLYAVPPAELPCKLERRSGERHSQCRRSFAMAPPNFTLQLTRPGTGPPPTPPPCRASSTASRRPQSLPPRPIVGRGSRRAASASARGTGRAAERGSR